MAIETLYMNLSSNLFVSKDEYIVAGVLLYEGIYTVPERDL